MRVPGSEFAKSIFLRKVEAGGVEIKAITLVELEFEDAGEAEIFFLPVKPGSYPFYCKGLEGQGHGRPLRGQVRRHAKVAEFRR